MRDQLKNLSQIGGNIDEDQVVRIVSSVCRKIQKLTNSKIIRVFRKESAKASILMVPFVVESESISEAETIPVSSDTPHGVVSWCVHHDKIVWLEGLHQHDAQKPARNLATDEDIDADYLDFSFNPNSLLALPLKTGGELMGVIIIETDQEDRFNEDILEQFNGICTYFGKLIAKVAAFEIQRKDTSGAIENFLTAIQDYEFPESLKRGRERNAFIARPFTDECNIVAECIHKTAEESEIKAESYNPQQGGGIVILDIISLIHEAHFFIVDLTSLNWNVMMEIGVILSKVENHNRCLFIRNKDDDSEELPFNIASFSVWNYEYDSTKKQLNLWAPGSTSSVVFSTVLKEQIISQIESDPDYQASKPYVK